MDIFNLYSGVTKGNQFDSLLSKAIPKFESEQKSKPSDDRTKVHIKEETETDSEESTFDRLRKFLIHNYPGIQAFNVRNVVGDFTYTVYDEDEIKVEYCPAWEYIEIFGISEERYWSLNDIIKCC